MRSKLIVFGIFSIFLCPYGPAKTFSNDYIEFELPLGWECRPDQSEWICQSQNEKRQKEAIIILAAKNRSKEDSIAQYKAYLRKRKSYLLPNKRTQISEPKFVKVRLINGHQWVDALHLASEVPGFYTRYMATAKRDIGSAVTFTVHQRLYNQYREIFESVMRSMKLFSQSSKKKYSQLDLKPKSGSIITNKIDLKPRKTRRQEKAKKEKDLDYEILLIVLALFAFVLYRFKKK